MARNRSRENGSGSIQSPDVGLDEDWNLAEMPPDQLLELYESGLPDRIEAAVPIGHWTLDLDGGRMTWSPGLKRLFGVEGSGEWETADELRRLIHPEDRESFDAALRRAVIEREAFQLEHRVSQRGGATLHVQSVGRLDTDPEGLPDRLVGITFLPDGPTEEA